MEITQSEGIHKIVQSGPFLGMNLEESEISLHFFFMYNCYFYEKSENSDFKGTQYMQLILEPKEGN